jgi:hypothetical protein
MVALTYVCSICGSPPLLISRIFIGHVHHGLFHLRNDCALNAKLPSVILPDPFRAMPLIGFLSDIEILSRNPVDLTHLGNALETLS